MIQETTISKRTIKEVRRSVYLLLCNDSPAASVALEELIRLVANEEIKVAAGEERPDKSVTELREQFGLGCHGGRDGECHWEECPQLRDGEPEKSGRHCPLDVGESEATLDRVLAMQEAYDLCMKEAARCEAMANGPGRDDQTAWTTRQRGAESCAVGIFQVMHDEGVGLDVEKWTKKHG